MWCEYLPIEAATPGSDKMTKREQALKTAKANHTRRVQAEMENFRAGLVSNADYDRAAEGTGYRHGWYIVDSFSFSESEITGQPYDANQGGWAWV